MQYRQLGKNGPLVSAIGYGCMQFAVSYGASLPKEDGVRIIREAFDQGVTLFDTAQVYGPFTNECLVGDIHLSHEVLQELEDLTSAVPISGDRYDEKGLKIVNR